jgi:hypothetical protein
VSSDLPYVDQHAVTIAAPRDRVWAALRQYATATTRASFPGARGQAYRALVIGTRAHVLATRHMLHAVRRLSLTER